MLSQRSYFQGQRRELASLISADARVISPHGGWDAAISHVKRVARFWKTTPEACGPDIPVHSFQETQCQIFSEWLQMGTILAVFPLLVAVFLLTMGVKSQQKLYRLFERRIQVGSRGSIGKVTEPPSAPMDAFSWFFCLKPIAVEFLDGTQHRVYLAHSTKTPLPGQSMAVYNCGKQFGAERLVGAIYAPHLVVVSGLG